MSGKASRDKGNRGERDLVNRLKAYGFEAERVPLSGAAGGTFSGDLRVVVAGETLSCEVKVRGNGFKQLYDWLGDNHCLIVRADRKQPLLVIPLAEAVELLKLASSDTLNGETPPTDLTKAGK